MGAPRVPICFEGRVFPNRTNLARYLSSIVGHSALGCRIALRRYGDDPERVIAYYRERDARTRVVVNRRVYKNRAAFFRHLRNYYGVGEKTAAKWCCPSGHGLTLERAEARAKELRAKRRPREVSGEVVVFGWRFRSVSAAANYYHRAGGHHAIGPRWREHVESGKRDFEFFLPAVARLWESGQLDERNRFPPAVEARMPQRLLPLNSDMEEITDDYERKWIDALQLEDADTPRRHALRQLNRLRSMTGGAHAG